VPDRPFGHALQRRQPPELRPWLAAAFARVPWARRARRLVRAIEDPTSVAGIVFRLGVRWERDRRASRG